MKVVAILQARMNSTRLPGKMLFDLAGAPLVQRVVERAQRATSIHEVVVAFPIKDYESFKCLHSTGCSLYASPGAENDLVGRYLSAADAYSADIIVRIPCDNPCVQPGIIDAAVERYLHTPSLYVSTMYHHLHDRVYADGLGAEVLSMSRLKWLDQKTVGQANYREHPHLLFQDWHLIDGWEQYQRYANHSETILLDVNTMDDYEFIRDIYEALYPANPLFTIDDILAYLARKKVTA